MLVQPQQEPFVHGQPQVVVVHPVGHQICTENAIFPRSRKFRDVPFAIVFLACACILLYLASMGLNKTKHHASGFDNSSLPIDMFKDIGYVWAAGLAAGTVVGVFFTLMLRAMPLCMVWTCLLATPATLAVTGLYVISQDPDMVVAGACLLLSATINLMFVMCYKKYVPMTAEVLSVVAHVLLHHLGMLLIGLFAAALHCFWLAITTLAIVGVSDQLSSSDPDDNSGGAALIAFFFIMTWGLVTVRNLAYVAYCGVFGQWYFGERVSTFGSFLVALTTSFGSVCFGSLLIAIIRTLRYIADQGKRSDNGAAKIMACVISCLLACVEDMVEWFSSFAYVQVAIRGCSFCDAARATMALCTSANCSKICAQILSGSVMFMGCLISGLCGTLVALSYASTIVSKHSDEQATFFVIFSALGGMGFGFFSAGNVMSVVEAGVNSILVCWAERPGQLERTHPEIHAKFMGTSARDLSVAPGIMAPQPQLY